MAFCEKCGKEIGPSGVCSCQQVAPVAPTQQAQNNVAAYASNAAEVATGVVKKYKKYFIIGGAVIAVLIVIAIISAIMAPTYKTPVKKLVSLINKQSTDAFAYLELGNNPEYVDYQESYHSIMKKNDEYKENYDEKIEKMKEKFEDIKGFKITDYKIVKSKAMKGSELRELQKQYDKDTYEDRIADLEAMDDIDYEDMADSYDISKSDAKKLVKAQISMYKALAKTEISDGYTVTLRFYGKYDGEEDKTEDIEDVRIIKMNGTWYILDYSKVVSGISFKDELKDIKISNIIR